MSDEDYLVLAPDVDFVLLLFLEEHWQALFMSDLGVVPLSGIF